MKKHSLLELRETLPIRAFRPIQTQPVEKKPFWWRPKRAVDLPIVLTGGIGDSIIALGLVRQIQKLVGEVTLYSDHPAVVEDIGEMKCLHSKEFPRYDYSLWINSVPRFILEKNFSGFRNDAISDLFLTYKSFEASRTWGSLIHRHPYLDNMLAMKATENGLNRESLPYYLLGVPAAGKFRAKHRPWEKKEFYGRFITIHDGFETAQSHIGRATKTWGIHLWNYFVTIFKERNPGIKVIQIGGPTSRLIRGVDISLVGKISFKDSCDYLARSYLHVDGDSGLVHAKRAFGGRSVVLFGPTNKEFFGYPENINISSNELCEGNCWWLTRDWLSHCPRGFAEPVCMDTIWPQQVIKAIDPIFNPNR